MEPKNYYDILGVSPTSDAREITAAKNALAKKYHPDATVRRGIDTTSQMQEILDAYRILSNPKARAKYDRKLRGQRSVMQTFDLHESDSDQADVGFIAYWKAAGALYDLVVESDLLFKEEGRSCQLAQLSMQALKHVVLLRSASIPERYWIPDIMNWLLFTWYQNRNLSIPCLLTLYDQHVKDHVSVLDKLKLQKESYHFQHRVKRLIKY